MTTPTITTTWTAVRNAIVNTNLINRSSVCRTPIPDGVKLPLIELTDLSSFTAELNGDSGTLYWRQEIKGIVHQKAKSSDYDPALPKNLASALKKASFVVNNVNCFLRLASLEFNANQTIEGTIQHTLTWDVWSPLEGS
jgi:hypothetical protein